MTQEEPRQYEPSSKHKYPKGFGSICPRSLSLDQAQSLLEAAIPDPDRGDRLLWNTQGAWCFAARRSGGPGGVYHGYPVVGSEVPFRALRSLQEAGRIEAGDLRRLRKQKQLPEGWR